MEEQKLFCVRCGAQIETDDYYVIEGEPACSDCRGEHAAACACCGEIVWIDDTYGNDLISLCHACYYNRYTHCCNCDALVNEDDVYRLAGEDYCSDCYHDEVNDDTIHEYGFKPEPIFYESGERYFGVELEIDQAGKDSDHANILLAIGNADAEHIYIKSDGSLDDGMEIVTHPMTLDYHIQFCWDKLMSKARALGYRSHQTNTCGLHIHVNRNAFSDDRNVQELVISRILYFVEIHWNELLQFSRRSLYAMNRWAARYGYEATPKAILDKAKKGNCGRYAAINLCNYDTVEFRLFRGTLKPNTLYATLQLVNRICDMAMCLSDDEIRSLSWSKFVSDITEPELVRYLKERRLYVNETVDTEEEM